MARRKKPVAGEQPFPSETTKPKKASVNPTKKTAEAKKAKTAPKRAPRQKASPKVIGETVKRGPGNRTTVWTQELADEICDRLAEGQTLIEICKDSHIPSRATINSWVANDFNGFAGQYTRARIDQFDYWADEQLVIADDASNDWVMRQDGTGNEREVFNQEAVARAKLRIDTRRWLMERGNMKKYGNKVGVEHDVSEGFFGLLREVNGASASLVG